MSPHITLSRVVGLLPALFACAVGPDYRPPEASVPRRYTNVGQVIPAGDTLESASTPDVSWWKTLHDPILDGLMERAVAGNFGVHEATSRIRESRAARRLAVAQEYPTLGTRASYARVDTGRALGLGTFGGGPPGITPSGINGDFWLAGFDASWEADVFGVRRRQIEKASAMVDASVEDRRDVLVSLTAEVASNYLVLRGTQRRLAVARENLAVQEDTHELTVALRDAGLNNDLDVANARTQVKQTHAAIVPLGTQITFSMHALATLLGEVPDALRAELNAPAPLPPMPPVVATSLPSELLRRRPDIRRAERRIAQANAAVGATIAQAYPRFSISAHVGLAADAIPTLFSGHNGYFLLMSGMTWDAVDFGRTDARADQSREAYEQAVVAFQSTALAALHEVENALAAYASEQRHREALAAATDSARDAAELARNQYRNGVTDFLEVLAAQGRLLALEDELARSDQAIGTDLAALYKALGGGWEADAAIPDRLPSGSR